MLVHVGSSYQWLMIVNDDLSWLVLLLLLMVMMMSHSIILNTIDVFDSDLFCGLFIADDAKIHTGRTIGDMEYWNLFYWSCFFLPLSSELY
jgi:hypothetical protein